MNVSAPGFYSDDPGRPGAITFQGLECRDLHTSRRSGMIRPPLTMQAPDSNIISFSVGGTTISTTTTSPPTPTAGMTTQTTTTPVPETTPAPRPSPGYTLNAIPATPPATQPVTTPPAGTPLPSPTSMPIGAWLPILSPALAMISLFRGKVRR